MADEFKTRKDIEILYDLIYNRTTDSPVTQKSEFDEFKETVISDYATKVELNNLSDSTRESLQSYANTNDAIVSDIQDDITNLETDVNGGWVLLGEFNNVVQVHHRGKLVRVIIDIPYNITIASGNYVDVANMSGTVSSDYFPPMNFNVNSYLVALSVLANGVVRITNLASYEITSEFHDMLQYTI